MQSFSKDARGIYRAIGIATGFFFLYVLCVIVFGHESFAFAYEQELILPNTILLALCLAFIGVLCYARGFLRNGIIRRDRVLLALFFPVLLCIQLFFVKSVWYYPGFDVANVYNGAALIAQGQKPEPEYFQLCPNNAPLTVLLALPLWVGSQLSLPVPYALLPYLGAILTNITLLLTVLCVRKLTKSRLAILGTMTLGTLWIGFSMLITIPYTDVFAIIFPVLALYIYLSVKNQILKCYLISFCCMFGCAIKATVLIVWISLIIDNLIRHFHRPSCQAMRIKRIIAIMIAIVLGAFPGLVFQRMATYYLAGNASPKEQLSATHYFMMGMNDESIGGHSPKDVAFSQSFSDLSIRQTANIQLAMERIHNRGFLGNIRFLILKTHKAFSDGLFAANHSFLMLDIPKRSDVISSFLRRLMYEKGDLNRLLATGMQFIWIMILILDIYAFCAIRNKKYPLVFFSLSLLGFSAYLLIFEVWPRYLFLCSPLFLVFSGAGLADLPIIKVAQGRRHHE